MDIAVDSSVLVALLDPRDFWRVQSLALERALIRAGMAPSSPSVSRPPAAALLH